MGSGEVAAVSVGKRRDGSGGGGDGGGDGGGIRSSEEEVELAGAEEVGGVSCVSS